VIQAGRFDPKAGVIGAEFMYLAELKGKLPSKLAESEDMLTSNVFSFFKYSNRSRYLKRLMSLIPIEASDK
jgi:hypothetical protein